MREPKYLIVVHFTWPSPVNYPPNGLKPSATDSRMNQNTDKGSLSELWHLPMKCDSMTI